MLIFYDLVARVSIFCSVNNRFEDPSVYLEGLFEKVSITESIKYRKYQVQKVSIMRGNPAHFARRAALLYKFLLLCRLLYSHSIGHASRSY